MNTLNRSFGLIFLIIFLFLYGLSTVTNIRTVWMGAILGICALISAVLLALGK